MTTASAWRRCTFVTRARTVSPGRPAPDEDDEAVEARDPVPAVGERVDPELELLVALHRRSHALRLQAEERQAGLEPHDLDGGRAARSRQRSAVTV